VRWVFRDIPALRKEPRTAEEGKDNVLRDVVVVGASAGGLKALRQMVAYLPADLPAAVLVTTHLAPAVPSRVAVMLDKAGPLPAVEAADGMPMATGRIYTAAPDRHLVVDDHDVLRLTRGPRENRARPAVDTLFRSAARWCGPRVIGAVLSGSLDDGAAGLAAIADRGGACLVQEPTDAMFDGMPRAALAAVPDAVALSATHVARKITELAGRPVRPLPTEPSAALIWETDMIRDGRSNAENTARFAGLGCPECGGGMRSVTTGNAVHFVCHTGHSYSPESFLAARDDNIESAVWTALSAMQEKVTVLEDLARRAAQAGDEQAHRRHHSAAAHVGRAARVLRKQLLAGDPVEITEGRSSREQTG
jgi:two-component system chemotaxis response regulator CheB